MSITRWITAAAELALSTAGLLVLLLASLLVALLSAQDTRGRIAVELGLDDEAAMPIPTCLCFVPELELGLPPRAPEPPPGSERTADRREPSGASGSFP